MSGQQHAPAALYPRERPGTHFTGGWLAPGPVRTGGKSRPHRDSIPDRPARSSVAIPTELPAPQQKQHTVTKLEGEFCETNETENEIEMTVDTRGTVTSINEISVK